MREILFRGIDEGTSEWVYGYYYECQKPSDFGGERRYYIFDDKTISKYNVIPKTVGQYIGIDDKNGTKIFEGDIVNCITSAFDGSDKYVYNYEITDITDFEQIGFLNFCHKIEIIGNIHDNPKLLKGE